MVKILVCGDVNGDITALYKRVRTLVKKNPGGFEALFCTGSFFAHDGTGTQLEPFLTGQEKIPLQTYILGPVLPAQTRHFAKCAGGGDLCDSLTFLGQRGVLQLANGLSVAYLSGSLNPRFFNAPPRPGQVYYTAGDVQALIDHSKQKGFKGVDVLLTSEWSQGICAKATPPQGRPTDGGSALVSLAAKTLMPRYHFAGQECNYFERPPYRNARENTHATRFLGLADVGNERKSKWLYAVAVDPLRGMAPQQISTAGHTATTTDLPFDQNVLGAAQKMLDNDSRVMGRPGQKIEENGAFFFRQKPVRGPRGQGGGGPKRPHDGGGGSAPGGAPGQPPGKRFQGEAGCIPAANHTQQQRKPPANCWFCLSSPTVEKHFIVTIGEHIYCALAKGALDNDHVLILPIGCLPSTLVLDGGAHAEIAVLKKALGEYYKSQGKVCVFFERNVRSKHLQIQVVAVPEEKEGLLKSTLQEMGAPLKIAFQELPKGTVLSKHAKGAKGAAQPFFALELPDGTHMYHEVQGDFPLQFGRMVMASKSLLDMQARVNWKNCLTDRERETEMTKQFRDRFSQFDPFNDDDNDSDGDE